MVLDVVDIAMLGVVGIVTNVVDIAVLDVVMLDVFGTVMPDVAGIDHFCGTKQLLGSQTMRDTAVEEEGLSSKTA